MKDFLVIDIWSIGDESVGISGYNARIQLSDPVPPESQPHFFTELEKTFTELWDQNAFTAFADEEE